jgi:hypothetical protein
LHYAFRRMDRAAGASVRNISIGTAAHPRR